MADLGFSPREGATGGGVNLRTESLEIMVKLGMSLELSEYPLFIEEESANET